MFCDNHVIISSWLKKGKKIHVFVMQYSFFWKHIVSVSLKKFSSNTIFRWYTFGKFYIVKFSYFGGRPIKVKERFEIFSIDHYADENVAGKY